MSKINLVHIYLVHLNLMTFKECVKITHDRIPNSRLDQCIFVWEKVPIFKLIHIQLGKINAHLPFTPTFWTMTTLDIHPVYYISHINSILSNLVISSMISMVSKPTVFFIFWFMGYASFLTLSTTNDVDLNFQNLNYHPSEYFYFSECGNGFLPISIIEC